MSAPYVLIVEDERPIREMMIFGLRRNGFETASAADAEEASRSIARRKPDLALVDWKLPGMSGLELVRLLRSAPMTCQLPIIMVTARAEEQDKVAALEAGADDYVPKPFSPRELQARISALLRRRSRRASAMEPQSNGLLLDHERQCVTIGETTLFLSPTDFKLLDYFVRQPERAHSRELLLQHVWGGQAEHHTVTVQIRRLRKALGEREYGRFIQTVRGTGYRFSTQVD